MKKQPVQCQGDAKGKQCGNFVTSDDARCWLHKNTPAYNQRKSSDAPKMPRVDLPKPKRNRTSDEEFNKPHYHKPDKEAAIQAGLDGPKEAFKDSLGTVINGAAAGNGLMVAAGTVGISYSLSMGLSWVRRKLGFSVPVREFGYSAEMEAAELESRHIILPSPAVEALVKEHWLRLEVRAEQAGVDVREWLNLEQFDVNLHASASYSYRTFRKQFYAIAAEDNPAAAAQERADEIKYLLAREPEPIDYNPMNTDYDETTRHLRGLITPALRRHPNDKERAALHEIVKELEELSSSLFTQELLEEIGNDEEDPDR